MTGPEWIVLAVGAVVAFGPSVVLVVAWLLGARGPVAAQLDREPWRRETDR